jgi:hypothetical protein
MPRRPRLDRCVSYGHHPPMNFPRGQGAVAALFFLLSTAGCGGSGPTTPSGPAATTIDDLVGDWSATIVTVTDSCYRFTWSARLGAGGVTGSFGPENVGTFTAALSGDTVSLSLDLPAGAAGPNACAVTGSGTGRASKTEIIGQNFRLNFTPACVGILMAPTSNDFTQPGTLTMRKSSLTAPACPANSRIFE